MEQIMEIMDKNDISIKTNENRGIQKQGAETNRVLQTSHDILDLKKNISDMKLAYNEVMLTYSVLFASTIGYTFLSSDKKLEMIQFKHLCANLSKDYNMLKSKCKKSTAG